MSSSDARAERLLEASRLIKERLALLRGQANRALSARRADLADLKRIEFHQRQKELMRNDTRERNQRLFAHGSNAEVGGYYDLDEYAVRGLEAHGDLYAYWMAEAALRTRAANRAELLRCIFSDAERLDFCVQEGLAVSWYFASEARAEETAAFLDRDAPDLAKKWRKKPVTARQRYDIQLIEARLKASAPSNLRRGSAHDWIALNGGHPDFWEAPKRPPEWKL